MDILLGLGLSAILLPINYVFFQLMKNTKSTISLNLVMIAFGISFFITVLYVIGILLFFTINIPFFAVGLFISVFINLFFKIIYTLKVL